MRGLWIFVVTFVLYLNIRPSGSSVHRIRRRSEKRDRAWRYAPYLLDLSFYSSSHGLRNYSVALDTYSKYFLFTCCKENPPNKTICLNIADCSNDCYPKEDGYCLHKYTLYEVFTEGVESGDIKENDNYIADFGKNLDLPVSDFKIGEYDFTNIITQVEVGKIENNLLKGLDGIMGLSYSFIKNSFNSILLNRHPRGERMFTFDIFEYKTEEGMFIMGKEDTMLYVENKYPTDTISWSEIDYTINEKELKDYYSDDYLTNPAVDNRMESRNTIRHMFTIYDMEICDSNMLGFIGTNWNVVINTNIEGLALPFSFYKTIETHIDFDKFGDKNMTLPSLTFYLRPGKNTKRFTIPLDLLYSPERTYTTGSGNNTETKKIPDAFHLNHRGFLTSYYQLFHDGTPFIHFGTRVLQHFVTIMDMDNHRVGLIEKPYVKYNNYTTFNSTTNQTTWHWNKVDKVSCVEKEECGDYQWLNSASNECSNPQCELYIFQRADDEGRCVFRAEFMALMIIIILMFAIVDCVLLEAYNCYVGVVFKKYFKRNPIMG